MYDSSSERMPRKACADRLSIPNKKSRIEGPKKVLVIGSSTGYGLASRIAVTYGYGADTIGVAFEREAKGKRTATAGY